MKKTELTTICFKIMTKDRKDLKSALAIRGDQISSFLRAYIMDFLDKERGKKQFKIGNKNG